jgi:hypothetical protein
MSMGACDNRITLYPAAPLEGWGSSTQRQIGEAKSAMVFASHTSDPPNAPHRGASEPLACHLALPVVGGLTIAPCGTKPCSTQRQRAIASLRATATIIIFRIRVL